MQYFWLLDSKVQKFFQFYYQPGEENVGNCPSKYHSPDTHQHVCPYFVHMNNFPTDLPWAAKPSSWQGCAKTLADPYKGKIHLARVNTFQEQFAFCNVIQKDRPNIRRANQYLERTETHMKYSFPPIATEKSHQFLILFIAVTPILSSLDTISICGCNSQRLAAMGNRACWSVLCGSLPCGAYTWTFPEIVLWDSQIAWSEVNHLFETTGTKYHKPLPFWPLGAP